MSGGAYGYFAFKLDDFIRDLDCKEDPRRVAFKELLKLASKACHDIEWVDSADYLSGKEHDSIDKVLNHRPNITVEQVGDEVIIYGNNSILYKWDDSIARTNPDSLVWGRLISEVFYAGFNAARKLDANHN